MSLSKTVIGVSRSIPERGETGWAHLASGLTQLLADICDLLEGVLTLTKLTLKRLSSPFQNLTATTGSTAIDFTLGYNVKVTLQLSTTVSFSGARDGERYFLYLKQDATGGRLVTWPAELKWRGGAAPTLTAAANARDVVCFMYHASDNIYLGEHATNFA